MPDGVIVDRTGNSLAADLTVKGEETDSESFDAIARLREIARRELPETPPTGNLRALHISLYCYKSFPIRIFHALSLKDGIDSHAIFFKNNFTNEHLPISQLELELLRDRIAEIDPHLITMSIMAPYVPAAKMVIAEIRKVSQAPVVAGGKFPTISPDEALNVADYVCKGEGELPLLRVFERMRNKRDFRGIKGLWYRDADGKIVDMDQERLYEELDDIPYPAIGEYQMSFIEQDTLEVRDPELDEEELLMMAGRGCVYLCSFCVNSVLIPMNRGNGQFVRLRSPEHVIEEINYRRARCKNAEFICFNDEVFGVFDDWVEDFCGKYKEQVGMPFECELVPKLIKEHNVIKLADAGMFSLHFGIQSGHDEIRNDVMTRPGTNDEFLEKALILRKYGVKPQFDVILDNPFDTAEALEAALDLLLALPKPFNLNTYKMQYFPHYPFTKMALAAGHVRPEDVTYEAVAESVLYNFVYRPKNLSFNRREQLENCVYLMPWNKQWIYDLVARFRRRDNPALGLVIATLAIIRYRHDFRRQRSLVWIRRLYLGGRMLVRGDVKTLANKVAKFLKAPPEIIQPRTGRISSR